MISNYLKLLRIRQWLKNLMLYFPPFLGGTLGNNVSVIHLMIPFCAFCLVSSSAYVFNDVLDKNRDMYHPVKCARPIASGRICSISALVCAVALLACSVALAWNISPAFLQVLMIYFVVSAAYSAILKHVVLADIFCISVMFLLRLQAGGIAYNVTVSEWLFLSVFLLSVFLSTGKRLAEKQHLGDIAQHHRKALTSYPCGFLEGAMYMTGGSVLVTYTMYVISRHSLLLLYSVPLCCFGLLRYMLRVQSGKGGDPTESLVKDIPLLIIGIAWAGMVSWGIYGA